MNEFMISESDLSEMRVQDLKFRFFHVLRTTKGGGMLDPEISANIDRYVKLRYYQWSEDWYTKDPTQVYNEEMSNIKRCEPKDFGDDEDSRKLYNTWITDTYSFDLFCPDYEMNDFKLFNTKGAMMSKAIIFRVEKCKNPPFHPTFCESDEKIEEFLS